MCSIQLLTSTFQVLCISIPETLLHVTLKRREEISADIFARLLQYFCLPCMNLTINKIVIIVAVPEVGSFQRCLKHLPVILATGSLLLYSAHIVPFKFAHPHLLIILTDPASHHNNFWVSRRDSIHAPTISLKP